VTAALVPGRCELCGIPLRSNNTTGVCRTKPACRKERDRRRRAAAPRSEHKFCDICRSRLNLNNQLGICGDHKKVACMRERKRREAIRDGRAGHRIKISIGDAFGWWTALENYSLDNRDILVLCRCGRRERVAGTYLVNGRSTSCDCSRRKRWRNKAPYLPAGMTSGRLTLLQDVAYSTDPARCRCKCGRVETVSAISLKHGHTRSCGCLLRDVLTTHGFSKHPLYGTWHGMLARCYNPKDRAYHNYGGRATGPITICDRWRNDPWAFAEDILREIGPRPAGKDEHGRALYSLDRWPDNDGNYEPGNVRWGTRSEQVINQRKVSGLDLALQVRTQERDELADRVQVLTAQIKALTG
jgi:hypothetical protein